MVTRNKGNKYIQSAERKRMSNKSLYPAKLSFNKEEEIKTLPDQQTMQKFVSSLYSIKEILKGVF